MVPPTTHRVRLGMARTVFALAISGLATTLLSVFAAPAYADDGQYVRTQSGKVRCLVFANDVGHGGGPLVVCEGNFAQAPGSDAVVRATGALDWAYGVNIGASDAALARDVILNYDQTYHINGWTILPSYNGTRFTNDGTGHGMFVSIDNVYSF